MIKKKKMSQQKVGKQISNRLQIKGALLCGSSIKNTAKKLKVSRNTVRNVMKNENIFYRKKRIYPKKIKKINRKMEKILEKKIKGKRGAGIKKIAKMVKISSKTIRSWLKKQDWGKYLSPEKLPRLSPKNVQDRKIFYKKVKKFGLEKACLDVAFSDEMPVRLGGSYNKQNCGVTDFEKNRPRYFSFKKRPIALHVWAFISGKGSSKLYFLDGKKKNKYR